MRSGELFMALSRAALSFFSEKSSALSDDQIQAAAIVWLELLKSRIYSHDLTSKPPKRRVFFAGENKTFLLNNLNSEHPGWEDQFINAMTSFLKLHRTDSDTELHYDYDAEDLLEKFIESVAFLKGKIGIFPLKTTMTFDDDDNIILNGKVIPTADILDPEVKANDVFSKLGCPRCVPAVQKIAKLLGY
jgi:hypothetical protein